MATKSEHPITLTIRAIDKVTGPMRAIAGRIANITKPVGKSFSDIGKAVSGVGREAFALGAKLAGLAALAGFGLFRIAKSAVEAGDKLAEMADRVGLGVDAYASLQHAAAQADVDQEQFNSAMDQFNKRLGEAKAGGGSLLAFLKKVSPTLATQVKGAKTTEAALSLMTLAMENVKDPAKRAALAAAAFGRSGLQMGQFLGQGSAAIQKQQLAYMALAGSQEEFARNAGALDNAMRDVETAFMGLRSAAAGALFPALTKLAGVVSKFITDNREGIRAWAEKTAAAITAWVEGGGFERLIESVKEFAKTAGALIEKLGGFKAVAVAVAAVLAGPLLLSVGSLTLALGKLAFSFASFALGPVIAMFGTFFTAIAAGFPIIEAFNLALLMNPIGVVIIALAALAAAGYQVWKHWDDLKIIFHDFWVEIVDGAKKAWAYLGPVLEKMRFALNLVTNPGAALAQGASMIFGADKGSLPPKPAAASDSRIHVDFANMPKGVRVSEDKNSSQPIDLNLGYSMQGG